MYIRSCFVSNALRVRWLLKPEWEEYNMNTERYADPKNYTEAGLWKKLAKYAIDAGYEVVKMVLELYYTSKAKGTPMSIKTAIWGALAYFIVPIDVIPDIAPGGYVDDGGVLAGALAAARAYMTVEAARRAKNKLTEWFEPKGAAKLKAGDGTKRGGVGRLGPGKADGSKYNTKNYRNYRKKRKGGKAQ